VGEVVADILGIFDQGLLLLHEEVGILSHALVDFLLGGAILLC